jgi:hypothetical protein
MFDRNKNLVMGHKESSTPREIDRLAVGRNLNITQLNNLRITLAGSENLAVIARDSSGTQSKKKSAVESRY